MIIALDPGKYVGGVAFFTDGRLQRAEVVDIKKGNTENTYAVAFAEAVFNLLNSTEIHLQADRLNPKELISEFPRVYVQRIRTGSTKANPNDLLPLAATVGAVEARLGVPSTRVFPSDWKGQIDPEVLLERIRIKRLDEWERRIFDEMKARYGSKWHHAGDAVGIGLHKLGRL